MKKIICVLMFVFVALNSWAQYEYIAGNGTYGVRIDRQTGEYQNLDQMLDTFALSGLVFSGRPVEHITLQGIFEGLVFDALRLYTPHRVGDLYSVTILPVYDHSVYYICFLQRQLDGSWTYYFIKYW